jgi:hypothetical protein
MIKEQYPMAGERLFTADEVRELTAENEQLRAVLKETREMNLQAALTDIEEKFCTCKRLTTSDEFWLGDHAVECAITTAIKDDRLINLLADVLYEIGLYGATGRGPITGGLFHGILHTLGQYGLTAEQIFEREEEE